MKPTKSIRFGRNIKDSKKHQTVWVTPRDIEGAICRDHQKCAVARALQRQLRAKWVDVGASVVIVGMSDKAGKRYLIPKAVREQIRYFDTHDGAFAPCKLRLSAPSAPVAIGGRTGGNARSGKHRRPRNRSARQQPTR